MQKKPPLEYLPMRIQPTVKQRLRRMKRAQRIASVSAFVREAIDDKLEKINFKD